MPFVPAGTNSLPDNPLGPTAQAGATPENFLIAAADLGKSGALSAPVPRGKALGNPAQRPTRRRPDIKVVR